MSSKPCAKKLKAGTCRFTLCFASTLEQVFSKSEVRDLVDVLALERSGLRIEDALGPASTKDGGLTPAQLACVLSEVEVGADARIPGGITVGELREFLEQLVQRLTRLAYPGETAS